MALQATLVTICIIAMVLAPFPPSPAPFSEPHPENDQAHLETDEDREIHVRPGAQTLESGTLGFFFKDKGDGTLYASLTGHGVDEVGQEIRLRDPRDLVVGTVVAFHHIAGDGNREDWALIRIDPDIPTSPAIQHWTGPSGMPMPGAIQPDDIVCHYGHGTWFQFSEHTRPRCGTLAYFKSEDVDIFRFRGTTMGGDSGSPVIHYETGQAIGLHRGKWGLTSIHLSGGMDICAMLDRSAVHGYHLELATASYTPPPPAPTVPITTLPERTINDGNDTQCFT